MNDITTTGHTEDLQDIKCPFCGERDFDLIGLKGHLLSGYCEIFESTERVTTRFFGGHI